VWLWLREQNLKLPLQPAVRLRGTAIGTVLARLLVEGEVMRRIRVWGREIGDGSGASKGCGCLAGAFPQEHAQGVGVLVTDFPGDGFQR
jgi:hypothetical protein